MKKLLLITLLLALAPPIFSSSGSAADASCPAVSTSLVDFSLGTLPFPDGTNITDQFSPEEIIFSANDGDLDPAFQKSLGQQENRVQEGTFYNLFRVNFIPAAHPVVDVAVTFLDSNSNPQIHTLTAFDSSGRVVDDASFTEGGEFPDPFTLTVSSCEGIAFVVAIEQPFGAEPMVRIEFTRGRPPVTQPIPGELVGSVDPAFPTVVITHGWQPVDACNTPRPFTECTPEWVVEMANAIATRLAQTGRSANVVTYTWPEAFTPGISPGDYDIANAFVTLHGIELAVQLLDSLPENYAGAIHFIGHSFGSLINALAVDMLDRNGGPNVTQVTILDAPMNRAVRALGYQTYDEDFFHQHLRDAPKVTWVDNYVAAANLPELPANFGRRITGAAPNGGQEVQANHLNIHTDFYLPTVSGGSEEGFFFSSIMGDDGGFAERPNPRLWNPHPIARGALSFLPESLAETVGSAGWFVSEGVATLASPLVRGVRTAAILLSESSDSEIVLEASIPAEASTLTFDFLFDHVGDGDWLTLSFDGHLLWSFLGGSFLGTEFVEATVPVAAFSGQFGELRFTLHSQDARNAEVTLANFELGESGELVTLDIVPRAVNPTRRGTIWVAILASPEFDAPNEVDKTSLTFGRTGEEASLASCPRTRDINRDGLRDLVCRFYSRISGFRRGDTEGVLRGATVQGVPIAGQDTVRIVGAIK